MLNFQKKALTKFTWFELQVLSFRHKIYIRISSQYTILIDKFVT